MNNRFLRIFGIAFAVVASVTIVVACGNNNTSTPDTTDASNTLEEIRDRGVVRCGIAGDLPGFSAPGNSPYGEFSGIDADLCYGLAAAVFGDASKAEFTRLTPATRFTALASGEVDVLTRNTTHTFSRDTSVEDALGGLEFTWYNFIDGQGFLVARSLNVSSALGLDGSTVCVQTGTTTELNLNDYFEDNNLSYRPIIFDTNDEAATNLNTGACLVYTTDKSGLAALRTKLTNPDDWLILPETISKEPLGPVVRSATSAADTEWGDLVLWLGYALINAEEAGITSSNVDSLSADADAVANVKRILGTDGDGCQRISTVLARNCFAEAIKAIGNYGELYERTVGPNTPLQLGRAGTPNALPRDGGALYAPPVR